MTITPSSATGIDWPWDRCSQYISIQQEEEEEEDIEMAKKEQVRVWL